MGNCVYPNGLLAKIKVLLVEPEKYPKEIVIDDSLEAMQEVVEMCIRDRDNIPDYLQDLYYATEGSSFEEVEEDIVAFILSLIHIWQRLESYDTDKQSVP